MNKLLCVSICFVATFGWVIRFSSPSVVVQSTLSGFPVSRNICLRNFLTCVDKNASVEINLKTGPYCPSYRGVRLIESRGNVTPLIRRKKRWTYSQLTRVCFRSLSWANLQTRVLHWDQAFWAGLVGSFRVLLGKKTFQTVDPNRTPSRSQVFVYL